MIDSRSLDDIAHRLAQAVPPGLKSLRTELERNFRTILQTGLDRLDLVTREQFEVQQALLTRTRAKLDRLEERVAEMEKAAPATKKAQPARRPRSAARATKKTNGDG